MKHMWQMESLYGCLNSESCKESNAKQEQHKGLPCSSASPRTATEAWLQSAAQKKARSLEKDTRRFKYVISCKEPTRKFK